MRCCLECTFSKKYNAVALAEVSVGKPVGVMIVNRIWTGFLDWLFDLDTCLLVWLQTPNAKPFVVPDPVHLKRVIES